MIESDLTADISDADLNTSNESGDELPTNPPLVVGEDRRLSASQPILTSETAIRKKTELAGKRQTERFPFLKVQEENERLQSRVIELDTAFRDARTRQRFAEEQLERPVQEVIEDYCNLQRIVRDGLDKAVEYDNILPKYNKLQDENLKLQKYINEQSKNYEQRIAEKEEELEGMHRILREEEFTLRSEPDAEPMNKTVAFELNQAKLLNADYLKEIDRLGNELAQYKERLIAAENNVTTDDGISRTVVITDREQELAHRVDELIAQNNDLNSRYISCNECLIEYMNKLNSLERKLMNAGLSSTQINLTNSFDALDKTRVYSLLDKMKTDLHSEKNRNKLLRNEVNQLMGREDSLASDDSVESAVEAVALEESIDEDKIRILKEAEEVLADMKRRGWANSMMNNSTEFCESFHAVPAIALEAKDLEMISKYDRAAQGFHPDTAQHVSLLNTSMGQFLQTSMNAAADITSLKENLGDFRNVLVTMFERLKTSAALFDEIRILLTDGEHNPLADKISEMQLMWSTAKEEAEQITKAVDVAERSIHGLQAHLSVLEQSILQTSFVLDHTRRMTLSNISLISHQGQGEPSVVDIENLKTEVVELTEELKEASNARDAANSRIELLEKHLNVLEESRNKAELKCEQLSEEKERLNIQITRLSESLEVASSDLEHQKSLLHRTSERFKETEENNVDLRSEVARFKSSVDSLEATREELCMRIANISQDLHAYSETLVEKNEENLSLKKRIDELSNTIEALEKSLSSARVTINHKDAEVDQLQQESQAVVNQLSEQLDAARKNAAELQVQLSQLAFKNELGEKTNITWSPTRAMPSSNSTLLYKSTMPHKSVQTELCREDVATLDARIANLDSELQVMLNIYNQLEVALHPFLFKSAIDFHVSRDVHSAQRTYEKFVRGLREKSVWETKTKEQMDKLEHELHNRTETSNVHAKKVTYKKTPIVANYKDRLRKDVYTALSLIFDLTFNLKAANEGRRKGYQFDLAALVDDAREIRSLLDELRRYVDFNKENMPQDMTECHSLINQLRLEVKQKYYELQKSYEQLKKETNNCKEKPRVEIVGKIDKEMGQIHKVLTNASGNLHNK